MTNGCKQRKCPCRTWTNCSQYIDIRKQNWRLSQKKISNSIIEWYETYFRIDEKQPEVVCNG